MLSLTHRKQFHALLLITLCLGAGVITQVSYSKRGQQVAITTAVGPSPVVGTLALILGSETAAVVSPSQQIELPDVDVFLRNTSSGATTPRKKTQLDGKFYLTAPTPGTYNVCWDAPGIGPGCAGRFIAKGDTVYAKVVRVRKSGGLVHGKALTGDNRPCWVNDAFFALDVSTLVTLFRNQSVVQPAVRANTQGEYVFAGVAPGRYRVRASCEKARGETNASVGNGPVAANITLPNRAPHVGGIAAFENAQAVTRANVNATLKVQAIVRDANNDAIEYLWRSTDDTGPVTAVNVAERQLTTAATPAPQTLYLIARDGKGGYAFKRFDLPGAGAQVAFSGRVIDETTLKPVAKAVVNVNGNVATTNDQGWFNVKTAPASPNRYVLNITHPQYALLSRVHDKASQGDVYSLIRVQTRSVNPAGIIDLTDDRSSGPCGGKPAVRLPGHGKRPTLRPVGQHASAQTLPCRRVGARLIIPAGALVDANGNAATNPVTAQVATLNPSRRTLPGDYRALDSGQNAVEMLSYGALYVQFLDSGGQPLNLKSGASADIRVPIPLQQLASAKPSIPVWSYDEKRGVWIEEGTATKQNTPQGPMYVGKTKHFSTINMDVAGNDPAEATCVRFQLGASLAGWTNLVVRAYVSYGGTAVQVKETALNGDQYHAIYRIPYAPPAPPPNTLRLELRGTYGGQEVVLLNNLINTDAPRAKMSGSDLWPPYPYTECGDAITLEADPVNLPQYGDIDATGRPAFLTGPYGQFAPSNGEQIATDYYNTIDPGNANFPTLASWWTGHGFAVDGTGGTRAAYLNHNDLGFGRDMNCKQNGSDLACYVTNYGLPDQNPDNADAAQDQIAEKRGATVAMEYKASEPADQRVRFFVYGGGDPNAAGKLKFADLDGLGPKSVPHLCIVCHGGSYDNGSNNVVHARFREFDLQSFKYSGDRSWDYPPSPDNNSLSNSELTAFATLNQMVRDIQPNSSAIKELIDDWYPGGFGAGTKPVQTNVPPGWSTEVSVYQNVYGKSCRTCHVARDGGVANAFITFNSSSNFQGTDYVVCGFPKVMPNAFITYKNFWNDLQRVIDFKNFTGAAQCQ